MSSRTLPAVSPAQITLNQNNYAGMDDHRIGLLDTDAIRNITGIAQGFEGRMLTVVNVGSNDIIFTDEDGASSAANRLELTLSQNLTLGPAGSVSFYYDSSAASGVGRWRDFAARAEFLEGFPALIVADQNDYAGMDDMRVARLRADATISIRGIANGTQGRFLTIINVGLNIIDYEHQDVGSAAANRILTSTAARIRSNAGTTVTFYYDSTTARWRDTAARL